MKTLQEQYNLIKEGKGPKDVFLKSVKRLFPELIPNHFGYEATTTILKQRGIISEVAINGGLVSKPAIDPFNSWNNFVKEEYSVFTSGAGKTYASQEENPVEAPKPMAEKEVKAVDKNVSKEVETKQKEMGFNNKNNKDIDNLYGEEFLEGYYAEMKDPKNVDKTVDQLKEIVRKNLDKDRSYYVKNAAFGIKGIGYETELPGLGSSKEAKGKYKSSGYGDLSESIKSIAQSINETGTN